LKYGLEVQTVKNKYREQLNFFERDRLGLLKFAPYCHDGFKLCYMLIATRCIKNSSAITFRLSQKSEAWKRKKLPDYWQTSIFLLMFFN